MVNSIINGDCLEVMQSIPDKSIDMILCDLPYGTTACKWDTVIPFEPLWKQYKRVIKNNGAIVLTASQPFTSALVMSNVKMFRYSWVWNKNNAGNFQLVKHQPLKVHEDVNVFSVGTCKYYPLGLLDCELTLSNKNKAGRLGHLGSEVKRDSYRQTKTNYPKSILDFKRETGLHPTQKPVALFEYLIKTYTNENETVLDNCSGSGTTAIACINTNRNYICIEKDKKYFDLSIERVNNHKQNLFNKAC